MQNSQSYKIMIYQMIKINEHTSFLGQILNFDSAVFSLSMIRETFVNTLAAALSFVD